MNKKILKYIMYTCIRISIYTLYLQATTYAEDKIIDLGTYVQDIKLLEHTTFRIPHTIHKEYEHIASDICSWERNGEDRLVDPICLRNNHLPDIGFTQAVDIIRPYIQGFDSIYNEHSTQFDYQATLPRFTDTLFGYYTTLHKSLAHKTTMTFHQKHKHRIRIPHRFIAYMQIQNYGFYAVHKQLDTSSRCALQNYRVAFSALDKTFLQPNEIFNINRRIAGLRGYCRGKSNRDFLFYGGVCGLSTQLFRLSLLIPGLEVTQRHPHSKRRVNYYNEYIFGDDAAIYEMNKQFEVKNTTPHEIYWRTIDTNHSTYLVGVTPHRPDTHVRIIKEQTDKLSSQVTKKIYDPLYQNFTIQQSFPSRYSQKWYGTN